MSPDVAAEVRKLYRLGVNAGTIVVVMKHYRGIDLTYGQVKYHLEKARVRPPKISKGRVIA